MLVCYYCAKLAQEWGVIAVEVGIGLDDAVGGIGKDGVIGDKDWYWWRYLVIGE